VVRNMPRLRGHISQPHQFIVPLSCAEVEDRRQ
jgi:hypothetical protein